MKEKAEPEEQKFPDQYYVDPYGVDRYVVQEKVLFDWKAPSKIERSWKRSDLVQFFLFISLFGLILLLLGDPLLFLVFISGSVLACIHLMAKPVYLSCKITTLGIKIEDQYYYWNQLIQYWFETNGKARFLYFRGVMNRYRFRKCIISPADEEKIQTTIGTYLLFKKPQQTRTEKFIHEVLDKIPLADELM